MWPFKRGLTPEQKEELAETVEQLNASADELGAAFTRMGKQLGSLFEGSRMAAAEGASVNASTAEITASIMW